jgi:hypothetical protein
MLTPKEQKWKYLNLKPTLPSTIGLIKRQTKNAPIRPIVNWQNTPTCKLAKFVSDI